MLRSEINLLFCGMAPGMLQNLGRREFNYRAPGLRPPFVPGMHNKQRRMDIAAFPQQGHRTL